MSASELPRVTPDGLRVLRVLNKVLDEYALSDDKLTERDIWSLVQQEVNINEPVRLPD